MVFLGFDGIDVGAAHPESIVTPFGMYCPPIRNPLSPHPESIVPPSGIHCPPIRNVLSLKSEISCSSLIIRVGPVYPTYYSPLPLERGRG